MALTEKQKKRFNAIRRAQGSEAAEAYRVQVTKGADVTPNAPAGTPPSIDFSNPQSVVNAQNQLNNASVDASTPNVVNDFGNRSVSRDPNTGKITVEDRLGGANKDLYNANVENQGLINDQFRNQLKNVSSAPYDPRKGRLDIRPINSSNMQPLPTYEDPRKGVTPVGNFRDMQSQVYKNALEDYTSATREDIAYRQSLLESQMINEGIPRDSVKFQRAMSAFNKDADATFSKVNRDAYRDSMDVGSQAFQNQLAGSGQQFDQNYRSGDQAFNQAFNARGQNADLQNQEFNQGNILNQEAQNLARDEYLMPHQVAGMYMNNQGRYENPNLGPVQSINTPTTDIFGYGATNAKLNQDQSQFNSTLDYNRWAKQGDWSTSRSNAGASNAGNSLADRKALIDYQSQAERDNWAFQQGLQGSVPQGSSYADQAGNFVANAISGGINSYGKRRY